MESITQVCRQCNTDFTITAEDLAFYGRVSPTFNGRKELIPPPTLCPDCRQRRRLAFRNERKLYKRKCDLTGQDILAIYSPDKPRVVYNRDDWDSDKRDPMRDGADFDFTKTFSEQFDALWKRTPLGSAHIFNSENTEYGNHIGLMKSCYLISASWECERVLYATKTWNSSYCADLLECSHCELCYECIGCRQCYGCTFCQDSESCQNSYFLYDCRNCDSCIRCHNLVGGKFCIDNVPCDKAAYEAEVIRMQQNGELKLSNLNSIGQKAIHRNMTLTGCENCTGDFLINCKNCSSTFNFQDGEDCKYVENGMQGKDSYDAFGVGLNSLAYEVIDTGVNGLRQCFDIVSYEGKETFYSCYCTNTSFCFGCIGIKNKEYCIFNKQYTKEAYETLVPKIIEHMRKTGEWGEFFAPSLSPFGYNETIATEYFPLSKEEAIKLWFNWSDYETPFPKVEKTIPADKIPNDITKIPDDILNWAIICEATGKLFRITKQELEFYRKHNLPIPKKHPDERHLDRMALRNPSKLYERKCNQCGTTMPTTYAPERPERVYCEACYTKEVFG